MPREACRRHRPRSWLTQFFLIRPQLVLGRIDETSFRLRRNASRANSMAPQLEGELTLDGSGTLVTARVRRTFSVYVALVFWLVPIAAVGLPLAMLAIRNGLSARLGLIALITIIFLSIACASLLYLGASYTRSESTFLREFLANVLESKSPESR